MLEECNKGMTTSDHGYTVIDDHAALKAVDGDRVVLEVEEYFRYRHRGHIEGTSVYETFLFTTTHWFPRSIVADSSLTAEQKWAFRQPTHAVEETVKVTEYRDTRPKLTPCQADADGRGCIACPEQAEAVAGPVEFDEKAFVEKLRAQMTAAGVEPATVKK